MNPNPIYRNETCLINGACFEICKEKGNGFLESVYRECLALEFRFRKVPYLEKPKLNLEYKSQTLKQSYEPDFLRFDKIIVEIKAVKTLADEHRAQAINYLKSTGKELGLLINFGSFPKIEHERFVNQAFSGS